MAKTTPRPKKQTRTKQAQARFLSIFVTTKTHSEACAAVPVCRQTVMNWLAKDADFKRQYDDAVAEFCDSLFTSGLTLARDGWTEPIVGKDGAVVGQRPKKSERLLELYLKAHFPEFRDKHEVTGKDGGPLEISWLP